MLCSCTNQSDRQIAAKIQDHEIFYDQIDSTINQYLSDELDAIYFARKMAMDKIIDNYVLEHEARKVNKSSEEYFNLYFNSLPQIKWDSFHNKVIGPDTMAPIVKNGRYISISLNTDEGKRYMEETFRRKMRNELIDSLKKLNKINIYLSPPLKQYINLDKAEKNFTRTTSSKNVLTIISDYECTSCRSHFLIFKNLISRNADKLNVEKIYYSDDVHLCAMAAMAASRQNKLKEYEDILYTTQFNSEDTSFFERVAVNLNLDIVQFNADLKNSENRSRLKQSLEYLNKIGIRNTPSVLINHRLISNYSTDDQVEAAILREINEEK